MIDTVTERKKVAKILKGIIIVNPCITCRSDAKHLVEGAEALIKDRKEDVTEEDEVKEEPL